MFIVWQNVFCDSVQFYFIQIVCVTEDVRAGADSVQQDTGTLSAINTNNCVYIRYKLRIGGVYTVAIQAPPPTHTSLHVHVSDQYMW